MDMVLAPIRRVPALVRLAMGVVLALLAVLTVGGAWHTAWAQAVLPVPALSARVIDQTGTLDATQQASLEAKLAAFETRKGSQIVVLMVPTTAPEDIASYANRVANDWKIGRRNVGDGVLVIVAKNDRRMRIEVAKTLEGAVPDIAAGRIIDEAMKPRFRQNDFAGGLDAAVDQIIARIDGEALPAVAAPASSDLQSGGLLDFDWAELGIFLFFGVLIIGRVARGIFGNKLGTLLTGAGAGALAFAITASLILTVLAGIVALVLVGFSSAFTNLPAPGGRRGGWSSSPGWGGGGWSGGSSRGSSDSSSGGFSSGGGGDFGGGGASGDW
jgi:uncharacterized protein